MVSGVVGTMDHVFSEADPPFSAPLPLGVTPVTWGMDATTTQLAEGNADDGMDT